MGAKQQPRLVGDEYVVPSANNVCYAVLRVYFYRRLPRQPRRVSDRVVSSRLLKFYPPPHRKASREFSRDHCSAIRASTKRQKEKKKREINKNSSCASRKKKRKKKRWFRSIHTSIFLFLDFSAKRGERKKRDKRKRRKETRRIRGGTRLAHCRSRDKMVN